MKSYYEEMILVTMIAVFLAAVIGGFLNLFAYLTGLRYSCVLYSTWFVAALLVANTLTVFLRYRPHEWTNYGNYKVWQTSWSPILWTLGIALFFPLSDGLNLIEVVVRHAKELEVPNFRLFANPETGIWLSFTIAHYALGRTALEIAYITMGPKPTQIEVTEG